MSDTPLNILKAKFLDYRQQIWGNSYTWSWVRPLSQVLYIALHHSATIHEATPDDIALIHKARGWLGVGYHFIIIKDGTIYYVGDLGTARANVSNHNEAVIGICLVGDFTKFLPSDEQIASAHVLCQFLINYPALTKVKSWDCVKGHKEFKDIWSDVGATACPGTSWKNAIDSMYERIKNNIPYSPIEPPKKNYEALHAQIKEDWDTYKAKNDPMVELYKWVAGEMNTDMEEFKQAFGEIQRQANVAQDLFNEGLPLIGETKDTLMFPDQVDTWKEKIKAITKELETYRKKTPVETPQKSLEPPKPSKTSKVLPEWFYQFLEWLKGRLGLKGGEKENDK